MTEDDAWLVVDTWWSWMRERDRKGIVDLDVQNQLRLHAALSHLAARASGSGVRVRSVAGLLPAR